MNLWTAEGGVESRRQPVRQPLGERIEAKAEKKLKDAPALLSRPSGLPAESTRRLFGPPLSSFHCHW
jgi:hypothetical protein